MPIGVLSSYAGFCKPNIYKIQPLQSVYYLYNGRAKKQKKIVLLVCPKSFSEVFCLLQPDG